MKKHLLKEQYARLFKGKPMSNDASLITEAAIKVTDHRTNFKDKMVFDIEANGKKFWVVTGDTDYGEWEYYQKTGMHEPDEKVSPSRIARQNPRDVYDAIDNYAKDNVDAKNMDSYTGLTPSASSGGQFQGKIYGDGPGKIEVKDHDDMREPSDNDSGFEGELEFEGTWDGEKWTATKEYLGDGAVFTAVYDANGDMVEETDVDREQEFIDAIAEYMDKEGLASE